MATIMRCNDCKMDFNLNAAPWCRHYRKFNIGSKACPQCGECICHGETEDEIRARFDYKRERGDFVKSTDADFSYACWTGRDECA